MPNISELQRFKGLTTNVYTKDIQSPLLRKINPTSCSPNISNCVPVTPLALRHMVAPALHLFRAELMKVWRRYPQRNKTLLLLFLTEMSIFELKFSMTRIQESLEVTSVGKLSSVLISPYNLSDILQQVSLHVPARLTMLTGLTVEEMYVYCTVAAVYVFAKCMYTVR